MAFDPNEGDGSNWDYPVHGYYTFFDKVTEGYLFRMPPDDALLSDSGAHFNFIGVYGTSVVHNQPALPTEKAPPEYSRFMRDAVTKALRFAQAQVVEANKRVAELTAELEACS